jgi:hypothetical protein
MDDRRLDRIETKVDRLEEINSSQNVTLAKMEEILTVNTESLKEHMKRTQFNEDRILIVEQQNLKNQSFLKGSIWAITAIWGLTLAVIGLYLKLR